MSKMVEIVNNTQGGLVINSLKLFIAPGRSVVKSDEVLEDSDIQELQERGMIEVRDPKPKIAKPAAPSEGETAKKTGKQGNQGKERDKRGASKRLASPESITDQMGRTAIVMDHGVPVSKKMNPGLHNTSDPIVPDGAKNDEAEDDKSSAFVEI